MLGSPQKTDPGRYGKEADYPKDYLARPTFELKAKPLELHRPGRVTKSYHDECGQQCRERQTNNRSEMLSCDLRHCVDGKKEKKPREYDSSCAGNGHD